MTAPVASGWSGCRVGLTPTGKRRLSTAHTQSGPRLGCQFALQQTTERLLDHLATGRERCRRHGEAERLGSGDVNDEIEYRRLLDRDIGRLSPAQNSDLRSSLLSAYERVGERTHVVVVKEVPVPASDRRHRMPRKVLPPVRCAHSRVQKYLGGMALVAVKQQG
jgi:hypothetical protein